MDHDSEPSVSEERSGTPSDANSDLWRDLALGVGYIEEEGSEAWRRTWPATTRTQPEGQKTQALESRVAAAQRVTLTARQWQQGDLQRAPTTTPATPPTSAVYSRRL